MKKILITALVLAGFTATAQVKIGNNPTAPMSSSVLLEMESTDKGLLISRMTTAQRTAIATPANGLQVFDTDTKSFWYFDATILPAPGAWVEGSSKGNEEWAYNGTDGIEAKRAKTGNNIVSVLDSGRTYKNQGNLDWATIMEPADGVTPRYTSDPRDKYLDYQLMSSDAMALTYPNNSLTTGAYLFKTNEAILKEAHVAGAAGTTKNYYLQRNILTLENASSAVNVLRNKENVLNTNIGSSSAINEFTVSQNIGNHYGSGNVGTLRGGYFQTRSYGAGNVTNFRGTQVSAQHAGSGTVTNLYGEAVGAIAGTTTATGVVTNLRGSDITATVNALSPTVTNAYGIVNALSNNSTDAAGTATNFIGFNNTANQSGAAKYTAHMGFNNTTINAAGSGVGATMRGITSAMTNSATSTDPITNFDGARFSTNHNGGSPIATATGINNLFYTAGTATTGIPNIMYGINNDIRLRTTQAGTAGNFAGIYQNLQNNSSVNNTYQFGFRTNNDVIGAGYVTAEIRGISHTTLSSSTGTGTTAEINGMYGTVNHTSATNTVTRMKNLNVSLTNSGAVGAEITGISNLITNNSTLGNNMSSMYGIYNRVENAVGSNDNTALNNTGLYSRNDWSSSGTIYRQLGAEIWNRNYSTNTGASDYMAGIKTQNYFGGANAVPQTYGVFVENITGNEATGSVANQYGVFISSNKQAGSTATIGRNVGLYIASVTGADDSNPLTEDNYAIWANAGKSYFGNNIGIGAQNPQDKLHIQTNTMNDGIWVENNSNSAGSPVVRVTGKRNDANTSQSFGAGIVLDRTRPDDKIVTNSHLGSIYFGGNHTDGTVTNNAYAASIAAIATGDFTNVNTMPTALVFKTGSTGVTLNTHNTSYGTERMRIDATGNMGIGTTAPTSKLQVVGLPVYATNAAAITAGLTAGAFYHAGDGIVRVVY